MTDPAPTPDTTVDTAAPAENTKAPEPQAIDAHQLPSHFLRSNVLKYINGALHQLAENQHAPSDDTGPKNVWVKVAGTAIAAGLLSDIEQMIDSKLEAFRQKHGLGVPAAEVGLHPGAVGTAPAGSAEIQSPSAA